jgi:hypothetical protein
MNLNIRKSYPGQAISMLIIEFGEMSRMLGYTFKVIDFLGKVVFETIIDQEIFDLDLKILGGRGTYFLQVSDETSQIMEIEKIVLR